METTRLLVILGELIPDDWLLAEDIFSREMEKLQTDIVNLKEHFHDIISGNLYLQGNALISTSHNVETTIMVNTTKGCVSRSLLTINSVTSKCYLVYAGITCDSTGDWYLEDDVYSYDQLASTLSALPNAPNFIQINGADAKAAWLQEKIHICDDKQVLIKFRDIGPAPIDTEWKDLVQQLFLKYLSSLSFCESQNRVCISLRKHAYTFSVNNFNVCVSSGHLVGTKYCQLYLTTGNTILPKELANFLCIMTSASSKLSIEAGYALKYSILNRLFEYSKGITTLYKQFNVGCLELHCFTEGDCYVLSLVWIPFTKLAKVVRLLFVEGQDFAKIIEGVKHLSKDKIFHNVAGYEDRSNKEHEILNFKLPLFPVKSTRGISTVESNRSKSATSSTAKPSVAMASHSKLDVSFSKQHADVKGKEASGSLSAFKKNKVASDVKPSSIAMQHKDKLNSVRKKKKVPTATLR